MQIGRRYLIHIRLGTGLPPSDHRRAEAAAGVKRVLESLAIGKNNCVLAYTSHDGASFAFFLKTNRRAGVIRAQLESPGQAFADHMDKPPPRVSPPLLGEDSILVAEVGDDFSILGFGKAGTWLQHH